MTTPFNWPAALPQNFLIRGFSGTPGNTVLRTRMELGRIKQRVRDVANYEQFDGQLRMTTAQVALFKAFWDESIGHGILTFNWVHPVTNVAAECQFIEDYRIEAKGPNWTVSSTLQVFT